MPNITTARKLGACILLLSASAAIAQRTVKIDTGQLKGVEADGVLSFKGVPFAEPPVGDLRWQAPQPAKPWSGVRDASAYGHDCMQLPFPSDAAPLGTAPSEDCLVVNVWKPAHSGKNLPVMVWIYGGGFVNGGSSPAVYDGSHFAKDGVILVSFNYRVGRFGFFAFPALTREAGDGPTGNFGYMDQIAALRWVQRNISDFGGDPHNVTIFGESAGGMSVHMLLTSPVTGGLFQKAIVESGGGRVWLGTTLAKAEEIGAAFAKSKGIEGDGPEALAKLRALPAEAVVDGLNLASMMSPAAAATFSSTILDGKIVAEQPEDVYRTGGEKRVSLIIGANSMDLGFSHATSRSELFSQFGPDAKRAEAAHDSSGNMDFRLLAFKVAGDEMMVEPARFVAQEFAKNGLHAWEYRFSYVPEQIRQQMPGMPHAGEIPFVFDTVNEKYGATTTPSEEEAAKFANHAWAQFAKTGNPNGEGLPNWPMYSTTKDIIMDFSNTGPVAVKDPWKARLDMTQTRVEEMTGSQAKH